MGKVLLKAVMTVGAIALSCITASANDVRLTFTNATNVATKNITVHVGATSMNVPIPPKATATAKRNLVRKALRTNGFTTTDDGIVGKSVTVMGLPPSTHVKVVTGKTGEKKDRIVTVAPDSGKIEFSGVFLPTTYSGLPAVFTAGIVTDVGVLTVNVSATELSFQTEGPIICQALFQRLAPNAPAYGAQITYSGDRLEVYFDPAYTVTQGGIIFGTNSKSAGCSGELIPEPEDNRAELKVAPVTNPGGTFNSQFAVQPVFTFINLPGLATANHKRNEIRIQAAHTSYSLLDSWTQPDTLVVRRIPPGGMVSFSTGSTGEEQDMLSGPHVGFGTVHFTGHFDLLPAPTPTIFTAGIVTDVGVLTASVSASELSFQTDGPIICQALFQRLLPQAPAYGANINYAGDRLEVYFDPAYTVTQGGVIFGTSSLSPGCKGTVGFPP